MHVSPRWVKQQFGKFFEALIKLSCGSAPASPACRRTRPRAKTLRVFLTPAPRPRFESIGRLPKRKASVAGGFQFQLVRRIGFRVSACADSHRLRPPAGGLARGLKTLRVFLTPAPRPRFESMRRPPKRKAPVAGGFQFQLVRRIGFEPMTF